MSFLIFDLNVLGSLNLRNNSNRNLTAFLDSLPVEAQQQICVVSIIGKSRKGSQSCKAAIIDECLGRNVFQAKLGESDVLNEPHGCEIEGYYDQMHHVVFLHVKSVLDSDTLSSTVQARHRDIHEKGFLTVYNECQSILVKALLMVFLSSHIVVVTHPTLNLDLSYLHLFRTIEAMRLKTRDLLSDGLRDVTGLPKSWVVSGRPCSPRVLFYFEDFSAENREQRPDLKKQELFLEDQLYRFLRRSRIITNICGNSLFAVCNQMDYVFIETNDYVVRDGDSMLEQMMTQFCDRDKKNMQSSSFDEVSRKDSHSFYNFLWSHLHVARTKGFDDNVGRHNDVPIFEKPRIGMFFNVLTQLRDVIFEGSSPESVMDSKLLEDNLRNLIMSDDEEDETGHVSQNVGDAEDSAALEASTEKAGADDSDDVDSGHRDLRYDPFEQDYYEYRR